MDPQNQTALLDSIQRMRMNSLYDYTLTFEYEVKYMWRSKWSLVKVLFFIVRYPPFADTSLVLYHQLGFGLSPVDCSRLYHVTGWMFLGSVGICESIIMMRTWAIWGRKKVVAFGLLFLFVITFVPCCILVARFIKSLTYAPISILGDLANVRGCFVTRANETILGCYICLCMFDTAIVILTVTKIFQLRKSHHTNSSIIVTMYKDGMVYYLALLSLSIISVVLLLVVSEDFVILLIALQRVMYSVLSARILLHIHKAHEAWQPLSQGTTLRTRR
ncbi:hypothetical protein HETIRDRAFT_447107 [Heterobasidion irregulare TC 32-1]|uniref:DUF6533 domain-containing protein n=1 Tax=Heterobasidion irregulare (strain TC 32-1) TaxID=747525 RepID=W4JMR5_HETIT|nr:uncharacterized protein HETIRDRAFT_447107 [Heterobasidion irregulare TC 32-1]ETW74842.1 hypothetical protein HETIRDRAFT_447107 [Heterobasidion irregulare TC 32-1]